MGDIENEWTSDAATERLCRLVDEGNELAALALARLEVSPPEEVEDAAHTSSFELGQLDTYLLLGHSDSLDLDRRQPDAARKAILRRVMGVDSGFAALAVVRLMAAKRLGRQSVSRLQADCKAVIDAIGPASSGLERWLETESKLQEVPRRRTPPLILGRTLKRQRRYEEAEAVYRDAIATNDPDHAPSALVGLAELLVELGRYEEAEAVYRDAIATNDPDHAPSPLVGLAELLVELGRYEEAEAVYRDAIATEHRDHAPSALVCFAELLVELGRHQAAEAVYRDAIATNHPRHTPFAMFELGLLLSSRRRPEEAEAAYREAIATQHPHAAPAAMLNLGSLLEASRRQREAEAAYRDAIATGEPFVAPKAVRALDRLLARQGRRDEAETARHNATTGIADVDLDLDEGS